MSGLKHFTHTLPIMVVLIMVGFFLRINHLTAVPLRGDEAFSVQYWAGQPLTVALAETATIEPHPVLTYAIFRAWGLTVGLTDFTMRMLPALAGLFGIPAIYAVGKRLGSWQIGLLAALLFALHPFEIWHAQDARNYAIWAGISLVALWLGLRALDKQRWRDWLLYTLAASLAANIFYTELLTTAAFGLFVLIAYWGKWRVILSWGICAAIAAALSSASFVIFQAPLFARGGYGGSFGGTLDVTRLWTYFLPTLNFGEITLPAETLSSLWSFVALVLIVGLLLLWRYQRRMAIALTLLSIIPAILLAVISTRLNIFTPRYILPVAPIFALIFAGFLVYLPRIHPTALGKSAAALLFVGWLAVSGISLRNYYFDPTYAKARGWPELATYLHQTAQPSDVVIQSAADAAFGYYYHQTSLPYAQDVPLPETPAQPISAIESQLALYEQQHTAIWQVGQEFPDWPNAGTVRNWLDSHMQLVLAGQAGGLDYRQYKSWVVAPDEITLSTDATFENTTRLMGYRVIPAPTPDSNLTVWLYWQPLQQTDVPFKVFVHLIGTVNPATASPLWTQDDRFPQNGRIDTTVWDVEEIYRDVYTLPLAGVPAGAYSLKVGLYNPETNQRIPVGAADSYQLQTIDLK
ncbi:MAG: glycosyltransferase family 39 protein [Chloroflexi bacterium]|nr:glycosyltransferase family 39 protein [Chloroflexota bacterium]MCC6893499.1 glycosyltransferase family 39 protein [Anaerolineae bacterium]